MGQVLSEPSAGATTSSFSMVGCQYTASDDTVQKSKRANGTVCYLSLNEVFLQGMSWIMFQQRAVCLSVSAELEVSVLP